jgi:23S rRNA G2445 N2-methylase RlmL
MNESLKIKLSFVNGLGPVVLQELDKAGIHAEDSSEDSVLINYTEDLITKVKELRSIARAYLVLQGDGYHTAYVSKHKSVLGNLIQTVVSHDTFNSFKVSCAGSDSPEVRGIVKYIEETLQIPEADDADLKIHIIKTGETWEVGVQLTPRPLFIRDYKVMNMKGAMDPTIAYAANTFARLDSAKSYLNVFSGSGTLLIEAGLSYPNLETLIGFDNDKQHLSLSIQNIKKAGLIKRVKVKEADIFDKPQLGKFDAIVSDVPFGMSISKDEDLHQLYKAFVEYCEVALNPAGRLIVYTSEHDVMKSILDSSQFKIVDAISLKFITNVEAYLKPKIFACELKS